MTTTYQVRTFSDIYSMVLNELKVQSGDTTGLNRVKRIINGVYLDEILPFAQWKWLRSTIDLSHDAYYNTGTVSVVQGSATATLSVAPSLSYKGYLFSISGQAEIYTIVQHSASSTSVTLSAPFTGDTSATASLYIWSDRLPLPVDCRETFEIRQDFYDEPLDGVGLQEFRRITTAEPQRQDRPSFYSTGNQIDPTPFSSISGLPSLSTRASSGLIKTLVFGSDASSYLSVGQQIEISGAGHYSYNGVFIVSSVSTTTVQFTGLINYNQSATADNSLTVKSYNNLVYERRYRELLIYPSQYSKPVTLHVDYIKEAQPLTEDTDQPLIPIEDRMVLVYGALAIAGRSIARDDMMAKDNQGLYMNKISRMAGKLDDSIDMPIIKPSRIYLAAKRRTARRTLNWRAD